MTNKKRLQELILRTADGNDIDGIVALTGLGEQAVRYHLRILIAKGLVEASPRKIVYKRVQKENVDEDYMTVALRVGSLILSPKDSEETCQELFRSWMRDTFNNIISEK